MHIYICMYICMYIYVYGFNAYQNMNTYIHESTLFRIADIRNFEMQKLVK